MESTESRESIFPKDFDWEIYRELHQDLIEANLDSQEQILNHWKDFGCNEKRGYRLDQYYHDFNWENYKKLNPILKKFLNTKREYEIHWLKHGRKDYLNLKYSDQPEDDLTSFNWKIYLDFNSDLEKEGIDNEEKAIRHWKLHPYKEKQIYKMSQLFPTFNWKRYLSDPSNKNQIDSSRNRIDAEFRFIRSMKPNKNCLIIISHRIGGGLSKYVNDVINSLETLLYDYQDYDVFTNENIRLDQSSNQIKSGIKSRIKSGIQVVSNSKILDIENFAKRYQKIILHFNIFPGYYLYTHRAIEEFFTRVFDLKDQIKLIITIHDFFWLFPDDPNILIDRFEKMMLSLHNINIINWIFRQADLIIFPTKQIQNHYLRKGIDLTEVNSRIIPHIDIYQYDPCVDPYLPLIKDKIKVLFVGSDNYIKGFNNLTDLSTITPTNSKYQVEFHILGNFQASRIANLNFPVINHGSYQNEDFFSILEKIGPTLLLLLSNSYESYSYTATMFLKSGLPIFYNHAVFEERISQFEKSIKSECYFYPYNQNIKEKFLECIDDLISKKNQGRNPGNQLIHYDSLHIPSLYVNIYNRDFRMKRIEIENNHLQELYQNNREKYVQIHNQIRPFAIYFPQFHRIKENDINFYNGFTDMNNLRRYHREHQYNDRYNDRYNDKYNDRCQIQGENLILTPLEEFIDYYDLLIDDGIIDRQIEIAKSYGIYGFAIYHYWFAETISHDSGTEIDRNNVKHQVMSKVIEKIFSKTYDNFYFYLIWANENWEPKNSLSNKDCHLVQDYTNFKIIQKHFDYLLPIFEHPNYYRIDDHPFFCIHHPWFMTKDDVSLYKSIFDQLAKTYQLNSIYFGCNQLIASESNLTDDFFKFKYYNHSNYKLNSSYVGKFGNKNLISYRQYIENLYDQNVTDGILSVFCSFDNTVRLLDNRYIHPTRFIDDDISNFDSFLQKQFKHHQSIQNHDRNLSKIFLINAWNEWGEYMSIEPSNERKYQYLETIQKNLIDFFI